jgi:hypothetical protein
MVSDHFVPRKAGGRKDQQRFPASEDLKRIQKGSLLCTMHKHAQTLRRHPDLSQPRDQFVGDKLEKTSNPTAFFLLAGGFNSAEDIGSLQYTYAPLSHYITMFACNSHGI